MSVTENKRTSALEQGMRTFDNYQSRSVLFRLDPDGCTRMSYRVVRGNEVPRYRTMRLWFSHVLHLLFNVGNWLTTSSYYRLPLVFILHSCNYKNGLYSGELVYLVKYPIKYHLRPIKTVKKDKYVHLTDSGFPVSTYPHFNCSSKVANNKNVYNSCADTTNISRISTFSMQCKNMRMEFNYE